MAQIGTQDDAETRADTDDAAEGGSTTKRRRDKPLDTLERVRRELSKVYYDAKHGQMPIDRAKALAYLLSQIAAVLKTETATESELAALLAQVRDKLGAKR